MIVNETVGKLTVNINKDTQIYGSFSREPGNFGCEYHNRGFQKLGINAIYKSFQINNIQQALDAMRTLDIKGAGVSMPFKVEVIEYVDEPHVAVTHIGAANTLVYESRHGSIKAFNTDYIAAETFLSSYEFDILNILGDGGYSKAVQYACRMMGKEFKIFYRDNWDDLHYLQDVTIFNCTPMDEQWVRPPKSCVYIDCLISTQTGKTLSSIQAATQFQLYTGQTYPF